MSVFIIGLNHRSAPLSLLERTAIPDSHLPKALTGVSHCENLIGAVVLSTCHRTEIYASASTFHGAHETLKHYLGEMSFVGEDELSSHLYSFSDTDAIAHLFCVISGLDSAVLGEYEIQGQVKRAWLTAKEEGVSDSVLDGLFSHALEAGKRVRRETQLARGTLSVSDAAVAYATDLLGTINDVRAVVLGAGDMGQRICTLLARGAAKDVAVASRTFKNASSLASSQSQNFRAVHLDELAKALQGADVLFTCTGASTFLLEKDEVERFAAERDGRPLLVMDVAVPRDVDPLSAEIQGITLKDIDDVRHYVTPLKNQFEADMDLAQEILVDEVKRYEGKIQATRLAPLITEFRRQICDISQDEFDRYASRLNSLEPAEKEIVEELVRSIINKVLHNPTVAIQNVDDKTAERLAESLKDLFQL